MNRREVLVDWVITRVLVLVTILAVLYAFSPPSVMVDHEPLLELDIEVSP